jgi:hypothetical protein
MNRRSFFAAAAVALGLASGKVLAPVGILSYAGVQFTSLHRTKLSGILRLPNTKDTNGSYLWTYTAPKAV